MLSDLAQELHDQEIRVGTVVVLTPFNRLWGLRHETVHFPKIELFYHSVHLEARG